MTEDDADDDPFERLGDVDREGDPFERLDDGDDADDETAAHAGPAAEDGPASDTDTDVPGDAPDRSDPFAGLDPAGDPLEDTAAADASSTEDPPAFEGGTGSSDDSITDPNGPADDPFAGMDAGEGDPFSGGDSVFERVDVGSVDADDVWSSITDDGTGDDEEPVLPDDDRHAEVSKHAFCEQCEHFSEPPEAHCTHESAEIIEYIDMERVRLLDCPVVAERKELDD